MLVWYAKILVVPCVDAFVALCFLRAIAKDLSQQDWWMKEKRKKRKEKDSRACLVAWLSKTLFCLRFHFSLWVPSSWNPPLFFLLQKETCIFFFSLVMWDLGFLLDGATKNFPNLNHILITFVPLDYQISMIFGLGRDLFLHVHKRPVCVWATRLVILSSLDIPYYYYFFGKIWIFLRLMNKV